MYEKGNCDDCGHYSPKLELDVDVGWFRCQKCLKRSQKAFEEEMAKDFQCSCGSTRRVTSGSFGETTYCPSCGG